MVVDPPVLASNTSTSTAAVPARAMPLDGAVATIWVAVQLITVAGTPFTVT